MSIQGPVFTDIQPQDQLGPGAALSYRGEVFTPTYVGLDAVAAKQVIAATFDKFRIGQTIFFEFEVFIETPGVTAVLLQPFWLRPQQEFRSVGPVTVPPFYLPDTPDGRPSVDTYAFGPPDISLAATERVWQTDTKREDQIAPAFPAVPIGKSYSNMVDNVWRIPINSALVGPDYSFTKSWYWPAHGYALAFTSDFEGVPGQGPQALPAIGISFKTGATHSISQENVE